MIVCRHNGTSETKRNRYWVRVDDDREPLIDWDNDSISQLLHKLSKNKGLLLNFHCINENTIKLRNLHEPIIEQGLISGCACSDPNCCADIQITELGEQWLKDNQ